jgi:K(+)-stimulated pyrophosphate-energized sodium pump
LSPVIIGFGINYLALGAFLAAVILTGQLMANFLSNSGGAWDNAKKYIEDGHEGGKGSEAHKAAVIGDTVGDPFKDTAGPALNPLIKVMNLVSLLILPAVISLRHNNAARYSISIAALIVLIIAVAFSKRKVAPMDSLEGGEPAPAAPVWAHQPYGPVPDNTMMQPAVPMGAGGAAPLGLSSYASPDDALLIAIDTWMVGTDGGGVGGVEIEVRERLLEVKRQLGSP